MNILINNYAVGKHYVSAIFLAQTISACDRRRHGHILHEHREQRRALDNRYPAPGVPHQGSHGTEHIRNKRHYRP